MRFRARVSWAGAAVTVAATCAGCGLGAGPGTSAVSLTITKGFGSAPLHALTRAKVPGSETVMRLLERAYPVTTRYGGGFVQSIGGVSPSGADDDWFYYVNGVEAAQGAASTSVHHGDHIWWDLHDWQATDTIPAVVGSFPEPFLNGIGGQRYPTTLECGSDVSAACALATKALSAFHVPASPQTLGTGSGSDTLGVVVGTWSELAPEIAAQLLAHGPGASGVYARFADGGGALELLTPTGAVARTLTAGAGLIAATADPTQSPTWLITGTDAAGVDAAARAFNVASLHDHFAVAVAGGQDIPVPVEASPQ
jgi:hypothetical protein